MLDRCEQIAGQKRRIGWFGLAIGAAIVGLAAAGVYAFYQFTQKGGCGFVRFFEHALGFIVLGAWLTGLAISGALAIYGFVKNARCIIAGAIVGVVVNGLMILVCILTVHAIREADYSIKSTNRLLELAEKGHWEERTQAVHELGNRRVFSAAPLLCRILEDGSTHINLKFNAASALGKLFAAPQTKTSQRDRAVITLIKTLDSREKYLPGVAAESLGQIGGTEAHRALEKTRSDSQDTELVKTIDRILKNW